MSHTLILKTPFPGIGTDHKLWQNRTKGTAHIAGVRYLRPSAGCIIPRVTLTQSSRQGIIKNVLSKTQTEVKEKLKIAIEENVGINYGKAKSFTAGSWLEVLMENYARVKLRPSTFKRKWQGRGGHTENKKRLPHPAAFETDKSVFRTRLRPLWKTGKASGKTKEFCMFSGLPNGKIRDLILCKFKQHPNVLIHKGTMHQGANK